MQTEDQEPVEGQDAENEEAENEAVAAPAAEAEEEAPEGDEGDDEPGDDQADDDEEGGKKPSKGVQKRIGEITAKRRAAERERDYWKQKALEEAEKVKNPPADTATQRPKLEDYETDEDYLDALTDWKLEQREASRKQTAQRQQGNEAKAKNLRSFEIKAAAFREATPDFDAVVTNPDLDVSPALAEAIMETDAGPALAYHIAKDPDKASELSAMSPMKAAIELGRIEASLNAAPAKKLTAAPDPIKGKAGKGKAKPKSPSSMTTEEWMAWRQKQVNG